MIQYGVIFVNVINCRYPFLFVDTFVHIIYITTTIHQKPLWTIHDRHDVIYDGDINIIYYTYFSKQNKPRTEILTTLT